MKLFYLSLYIFFRSVQINLLMFAYGFSGTLDYGVAHFKIWNFLLNGEILETMTPYRREENTSKTMRDD